MEAGADSARAAATPGLESVAVCVRFAVDTTRTKPYSSPALIHREQYTPGPRPHRGREAAHGKCPVPGMTSDGAFVFMAHGLRRVLSASAESSKRRHDRLERSFETGTLPLILLAVLVVIVPLAYASPTDPTWIAGIYDADDYDDVLDLLTDTNAVGDFGSAVGVQPTVAVQPLSAVVARVACSSAVVLGIGVLLAFCFRSPPERLNRQFECDWVGWRIWQRSVQGSRPDGAFVFWALSGSSMTQNVCSRSLGRIERLTWHLA